MQYFKILMQSQKKQATSPKKPKKNKKGKSSSKKIPLESLQFEPVVKNKMMLYFWSMCIAMGSLAMGYLFVIVTVLSNSIEYGITLREMALAITADSVSTGTNFSLWISVCTTALPLGALLGSLLYSGAISAVKSENKLMVAVDFIMIGLTLLQLVSLNIYLLTLTRLLQGICIGVTSIIVPTYLISISPTKLSGLIGSFNQIFITVGIALAYLMGYKIDEQNLDNPYNWRIVVFLPALMLIVRIIACQAFKLDTLERHIENEEWDAINEYLREFYVEGTFTIEDLIRSKKSTSDSKITSTQSLEQSQQQQPNTNQGQPQPKNEQVVNSAETSLSNRRKLSYILCILNQFCGINAILFYSNQLFENISNGDTNYAVRKSLELGIFQIIVTLFSGGVMDLFGRRTLMIFGDAIIIAALLCGYYMVDYAAGSWDPAYVTYAIFAHIGGFSLSLGPVTVVYITEIIEDISPFMTFIWVETIFIALTSNIMIEYLGIGKVFLFYAVVSLTGLVYVFGQMHESKGRNRKQMADLYADGSGARVLEEEGLAAGKDLEPTLNSKNENYVSIQNSEAEMAEVQSQE